MKQKLEELAVFGGDPEFPEQLHVGRPNTTDREELHRRLDEILDRRFFTNAGPCSEELEQRIAERVGVEHCIAMCNGTIALEIITRALGMSGEVIVPSFTFIATAHALQWQEITPVFCDVDPRTHNIDPAMVERLITPRTTGIIGVHTWGRPCPIEELEEIAARRHLRLVFDAAHAFACTHRGRQIGSFGDAEVYSFHATKFFNTFEGGAVLTDDGDIANKVRLMKNFGFAGVDEVIHVGTNGKMNEFCAAVGLTSLDNVEEYIAVNRANYQDYLSGVSDIPGIDMVTFDEGESNNYQYVVLEVDEGVAGIGRDELVAMFEAEGVLARRYFYPGCHAMEPYASYYPHSALLLPNTVQLVERVLLLPTGTAVGREDVAAICGLLRLAVQESGALRSRLAGRSPAGN